MTQPEQIIVIAKMTSENEALSKLQQSLNEYKIIRNDNNKARLVADIVILLVKYSTEDKTLTQALSEVENFKHIKDMITNVKQQ